MVRPMAEDAEGTEAEVVAAERAIAPRVAVLTLIAAVLPFIGSMLQSSGGSAPNNMLAQILRYENKSTAIIAGSALIAVGIAAKAVPLIFLQYATISRGGRIPRLLPRITIIAAIAYAIGSMCVAIVLTTGVHKLVTESGMTFDQVRNMNKDAAVLAASGVATIGMFALTFAFVMASLNAMRVGLLNKFMGNMGMFAAALPLLSAFPPIAPLAASAPLLQAVWLIALAALIFGRWPGGPPIAWQDGEAHPWPTAAEARAEAAGRRESDAN